jgi:hypothetical protein
MDRNLSPYGHSAPTHVQQGVWSPDYLAAAFERARFKVSNVVPEAPVGPDGVYRVYAFVYVGIGLLWLGLVGLAVVATGEPVGLGIWPFLLIAGSLFWFNKHTNSNPNTPERALHAWISALNRKKWERVDRLRLHTDRDNFPRRIATPMGALELPMGTVAEVEQYWKELRSHKGLHQGQWYLKKVQTHARGQGIAVVTGELSVPRVKPVYALVSLLLFGAGAVAMIALAISDNAKGSTIGAFFLLAMVLALLVSLIILARRRKMPIRKIVIYNGHEWRMLSGEWQAPEDNDDRWMG